MLNKRKTDKDDRSGTGASKRTRIGELISCEKTSYSVPSCPICLDFFDKPVILPSCGHTLCFKCAETLVKSNLINCPECRTENKLGPPGVKCLKTNYALTQLADEVLAEKKQTARKASLGYSCPHISDSIEICTHCNQQFCRLCLPAHIEMLKLEASCIFRNFENRRGEILKIDREAFFSNLRGHYDENARLAEESIKTTYDGFLAKIKAALDEQKRRALEKSHDYFDSKYTASAKLLGEQMDFLWTKEFDNFLVAMRSAYQTSPFYANLEEVVANHKKATDIDFKLQILEENGLDDEDVELYAHDDVVEKVIADLEAAHEFSIMPKNKDPKNRVATEFKELHRLIIEEDLDNLKKMLQGKTLTKELVSTFVSHADPCQHGCTPLIQAVLTGNLDLVRFLVEELNVDLAGYSRPGPNCSYASATALHWAVLGTNIAVLKYLVEKSPDVLQLSDGEGESVFNWAVACRSSLAILEFLSKQPGLDLSHVGEGGRTALAACVKSGSYEAFRFLLSKGCDVRKHVKKGETVFHHISDRTEPEILEYLFKTVPDLVDTKKDAGDLPVHIAASCGNIDAFRRLCTQQNVSSKNSNGLTCALIAVENDNLNLLKVLTGFDMSHFKVTDADGNTPLHIAVSESKIEVVKFLIGNTPFITSNNRAGKSPQDLVGASSDLALKAAFSEALAAAYYNRWLVAKTPKC